MLIGQLVTAPKARLLSANAPPADHFKMSNFSNISDTFLLLVLSVCVVENLGSFNMTEPEPSFGAAPNMTRVQLDSHAFLHCPVYNLGEHQVIFIFKKLDMNRIS